MSETVTEAEKVVRQYADLWEEQDVSSISDVVSETFVHRTPPAPGGEARGPGEVEAFMRQISSAFSDLQIEIVDSLTSGDRAMIEAKFNMTHTGEFNGIPATGREIEFQSLGKVLVADGELQEYIEYLNLQELLEQLEVTD